MNSIVENLLKEMEKCNSKNNRCDYLLEHSEIDYLLEYIDQLQQENQKYKEVIDKAYIKVINLLDYYNHYKALPKNIIDELMDIKNDVDILKEVE